MKRILLLAAITALVVPGVAEAKKKHRTCNVRGSTTVEANSKLRVYGTFRKGNIETRACRLKNGKKYLLSSGEDFGAGDTAELVTLSGYFVAYALNGFDDSQRYNPDFKGFANKVVVLDIRSGQSRSATAVGSGPGSAFSLVLAPNGSIAWIGVPTSTTREVRKMAIGAGPVLLDSGPDVKDNSLAFAGGTVYWLKGGAAQSAPLG